MVQCSYSLECNIIEYSILVLMDVHQMESCVHSYSKLK